jgi:hypothetical protein
VDYFYTYRDVVLKNAYWLRDQTEESEKEYLAAEDTLLLKIDPKAMDGASDSFLFEVERKFIDTLNMLVSRGFHNPEQMSVLTYYSMLDRIEEENRKKAEMKSKRESRRKAAGRRKR